MNSLKLVFYVSVLFCYTHVFSQTRITHYQTPCDSINAGGQYTSITTAPNGDIYTAWVDVGRNFKVLRIKTNGTKDSIIVRTNIQINQYHVRPSIVIDNTGFIHVTGDMHTQPWVYYRSLLPYNILGGFLQVFPPGFGITYVNFFKDKNDSLYITFRQQTKPNSTVGSRGGGIMKYSTLNKSFTMLGGTNHGLEKTVVWVNNGGAGTFNPSTGLTTPSHYQQFGIQLFFDKTNRMHLACTIINEATTGTAFHNTHVLYAYSDNGGISFKRVDGAAITSLPMNPINMSVVEAVSPGIINAVPSIGAFDSATPVISYSYRIPNSDGLRSRIRKWNGSSWEVITPGGINTIGQNDIFSRRNGESIFWVDASNYYYFTRNKGLTYIRYNITPTVSGQSGRILDADYFIKSGNMRYNSMSSNLTNYTYYTATINTPTSSPLPIKVVSFTGKKESNKIVLSIQAWTDKNSEKIVVQKLDVSNNAWNDLGVIQNFDNTQALRNYSFIDENIIAKNTYRLLLVDKDGSSYYAKVIQVMDNLAEPKSAVVYPNPCKRGSNPTLLINNPKLLGTDYVIHDAVGRIVYKGKINKSNQLISTEAIPKGFYTICLNNQIAIKISIN